MSAAAKNSNEPRPSRICADACGPYCPCELADLGECFACSAMRGETMCECAGDGPCVWAHCRGQRSVVEVRVGARAPILSCEAHPGDIWALRLRVPPALAAALRAPGSFVFIRGDENPRFDVPTAVVYADPERRELTLAYRVAGPKTKRLRQAKEFLWLRGPYGGGIVGRRAMDRLRGGVALLVGDGMSLASLPNIHDKLRRNGNKVVLLLGLPMGGYGRPFLPDEGIGFTHLERPEGMEALRAMLAEHRPDLVFCGAGRFSLELVAEQLRGLDKQPVFSRVTGRAMCCGEGVCGACVEVVDGRVVRTCKTVL